jgi:hypothetical protein
MGYIVSIHRVLLPGQPDHPLLDRKDILVTRWAWPKQDPLALV